MWIIALPLLFLFLASPVLLIIGLMDPSIINQRSKRTFTRKGIVVHFGLLTILSFVLFVVVVPKEKQGDTAAEVQGVLQTPIATPTRDL